MKNRMCSLSVALAMAAGMAVTALGAGPGTTPADRSRTSAETAFQASHPGTSFYRTGSMITTISGAPAGFGATPADSVAGFLQDHARVLGVAASDLVPGSLAADGLSTREFFPIRDAAGQFTGQFKFTMVSFLQTSGGIPVFNGDVRFVVRNEPNAPLVLVRSALFDLGNFRVNNAALNATDIALGFKSAMERFPGIGNFSTDPRLVVFAGDETSRPVAPALAYVFEGSIGAPGDPAYSKQRIVADAATGAILWTEDLIRHVDVSGQITGMATTGIKTAECNAEAVAGMPYARATIGATSVFADKFGNFTVPNAGSSAVTVTGSLQGQRFEVFTPSALEPTIAASVTPPGPANIQFNAANSVEVRRASVNAYLQANVVRDYVLAYSPSYPTIATQTAFRINVAVSGTCNAFYDGTSINFYNAGGGCANTAYNDVVHHEYGHHVVEMAGSGQGEYGEGTGDCMGVLISDQPVLGYGFQNNCAAGIRNASNACQYSAGGCSSCGSEIHACGQLISGCVWSLRNELLATNPSDYRTILSDIVINAVIVHAGTGINSQIYTDYLTLDDDDANLGNGTPHFCQITKAFADHGLATFSGDLSFTYPLGRPEITPPAGGGTVRMQVAGLCSTPQAGTGVMYIDPENDGSFVPASTTQVSTNVYDGTFPVLGCNATVRYYFAVTTTASAVITDPPTAPAAYYTVVTGDSSTTPFQDTFQTNLGWVATVSGATSGGWQRGVPANGARGDPPTDSNDTGTQCYLTQNATGDTDVDGGSVLLTSPAMNATGGTEAYLSYARWYDNTGAGTGGAPNADTFLVQVSNNNGGSWVTLETVGPVIESSGGWVYKTFALSPILPLATQMKVRFTASDLATGSVVEAAVDAVKLQVVGCHCPADVDNNGYVNGDDFDSFMFEFYFGNPAADFDGNTFVNGDDFDAFTLAFYGGC